MPQRDSAARAKRALHRIRVRGLDTDDANLGAQPLDVGGDTADEPSTADRDEDGVDRLAQLAQNLHCDGPLAGNHVGIVVGMHERELAAACDLHRLGVRLVVGVALEHDRRSECLDRVDLDLGRRHRHHDRGARTQLLGRKRDPLRMVSRRCGDHTVPKRSRGESRHLVVRAAELEREDGLEILTFQ